LPVSSSDLAAVIPGRPSASPLFPLWTPPAQPLCRHIGANPPGDRGLKKAKVWQRAKESLSPWGGHRFRPGPL